MSRHKALAIVILMAGLSLGPAEARTTSGAAARVSQAAVHQALGEWARALGAGQGEGPIVALYAKNAILLSTFDPKPLDTPQAIAAYFHGLTMKPGLGVEVRSEKVETFGGGGTDSGLYTFHYMEGDKRVDVPARFTFVWRFEGGRLQIVAHHSSVEPASVPH
jgi:hypothetical protein